jgi:3-hydroxyisobutyrate dehydrogenase-like beta-hydroxyacid dehydrogenase
MGSSIAGLLVAVGYAVFGYDVRIEALDAATAAGAIGCATVAEMSAQAEVVDDDTASVFEVILGALRS